MLKHKKAITIGLAAVIAAFLIACGGTPASKPTAAPAATVTAAPSASAAPATPAAPAVPTVTDGTWTVGEDMPAGTYKTTGSSDDCYWAILKSGTNGADIIKNDIGGGNLRVTLKAGQDFKTQRCGTWTKVG